MAEEIELEEISKNFEDVENFDRTIDEKRAEYTKAMTEGNHILSDRISEEIREVEIKKVGASNDALFKLSKSLGLEEPLTLDSLSSIDWESDTTRDVVKVKEFTRSGLKIGVDKIVEEYGSVEDALKPENEPEARRKFGDKFVDMLKKYGKGIMKFIVIAGAIGGLFALVASEMTGCYISYGNDGKPVTEKLDCDIQKGDCGCPASGAILGCSGSKGDCVDISKDQNSFVEYSWKKFSAFDVLGIAVKTTVDAAKDAGKDIGKCLADPSKCLSDLSKNWIYILKIIGGIIATIIIISLIVQIIKIFKE